MITNQMSKDTQGTGRIKTQSLCQISKRNMDTNALINNKITGDKLSKQIFPKQVATKLPLLN